MAKQTKKNIPFSEKLIQRINSTRALLGLFIFGLLGLILLPLFITSGFKVNILETEFGKGENYSNVWYSLGILSSLSLALLAFLFIIKNIHSSKKWLVKLVGLFAFLLVLGVGGTTVILADLYLTPPSQKTPSISISETEVLTFVNNMRAQQKLKLLKRNEQLDKAAYLRLRAIIDNQEWKSGMESSLTREDAVLSVKYQHGGLGHLVGFLYQNQKSSEIFNFWRTNRSSKETILETNSNAIGIATSSTTIDGFHAVIVSAILASPPVVNAPVQITQQPIYHEVSWGGPDLWDAVNKRRVEMGVNPLKKKDELCTVAAIRLNQLLDLGKLDGHAGFVPTLERPDLQWIREKYTLNEFLIVGYLTPQETVKGWEHTLGHRSLVAGGEHSWGCIYAQNTFGVAITAY